MPANPCTNVAAIVHDFDNDTIGHVHFETPEWIALLEWLEFHGINPKIVPAFTMITRSGSGCCIRYVQCVFDEDGRHKVKAPDGTFETVDLVEQGEAPPKPWPDEIARLLR